MNYEDIIALINSTEARLTVHLEKPMHDSAMVAFKIADGDEILGTGSVTVGTDEDGDALDPIADLLLDRDNFALVEYASLAAETGRTEVYK